MTVASPAAGDCSSVPAPVVDGVSAEAEAARGPPETSADTVSAAGSGRRLFHTNPVPELGEELSAEGGTGLGHDLVLQRAQA